MASSIVGYFILFICIGSLSSLIMMTLFYKYIWSLKFELKNSISISDALLQKCLDEYTSQGHWIKNRWVSPISTNHACPSFDNFQDPKHLSAALLNFKIGFMGDSTTRSDLRAWQEHFDCPRTTLGEAALFQRLDENGLYICETEEQSINLTKCGIPPILNLTNCPEQTSGKSPYFRYFYKIYPWTPLDKWYFENVPDLFFDLDVLVISIGRWLPYRHINVTQEIDQFLVNLKKVYSGLILFQSQYAEHTVSIEASMQPVNCQHGLMNGKYECEQVISYERPEDDDDIQAVAEEHGIPFLDRWNVSKSLPLEYYSSWLCGQQEFHSWYCDHHLSFVAMQHLRLIANVINMQSMKL